MFKVIVLARRKPGMSMAEFRDYYENHHSVSGLSVFPYMRRYVRNYLSPVESDLAASGEAPFDCVTEAWFDREEDYRRAMAFAGANPDKVAAHARDEENLFDRPTIWWFTAEECETDFGARSGAD